MVVKFQKAVFGGKKVLIYDKKESICQEIPLTTELDKLFGKRYKMYRQCVLDKKGNLHIGGEVKGFF